jgi:hypothetical protein
VSSALRAAGPATPKAGKTSKMAKAGPKIGYGLLGVALAIAAVLAVLFSGILRRGPERTQEIGDQTQVTSAPESTKPNTSPELQKAEEAVLSQLKSVRIAYNRVNLAVHTRDQIHDSGGKTLPSQAAVDAARQRYHASIDEVNRAEAAMAVARSNFEIAFGKYQQLGGKTDYRSQLP